jgi:signal transduction histidine kinase
VVVLALAAAGLAFVVASRQTLLENLDASTAQRAAQVTEAVLAGDRPAVDRALRSSPADPMVVQIIDQRGIVVAASATIVGAPPITRVRPPTGRRLLLEQRLPIADDDTFRVVATGVPTRQGTITVLVGQSMDAVNETGEVVTESLAVGLPALAVLVGAATFLFVGRALRPVEAMRRQAATISATTLHARLPVPPARDEIAGLAVTMNGMLDRIEAAAEAQRRFVADASHELRSPLTTIRAGLELLDGDALPDGARENVRRMDTESSRMARLIEDLLLLARVDERGLGLRHGDVDLDDLTYAERGRLAERYPALRVSGQIEPVRVTGDPHHLGRALRNLTDNAARHAHSAVVVTLGADDGQARLTVADDGPGIAAADRDRIFDRFVRLDDSRSRAAGGTGLGLSIAREIIAAHGGTVEVVDGASPGATVEIRLPLPNR